MGITSYHLLLWRSPWGSDAVVVSTATGLWKLTGLHQCQTSSGSPSRQPRPTGSFYPLTLLSGGSRSKAALFLRLLNKSNWPWKIIRLWDVKNLTRSEQSTHRWRRGCQTFRIGPCFTPHKHYILRLLLVSVRGWENSQAPMRLEE